MKRNQVIKDILNAEGLGDADKVKACLGVFREIKNKDIRHNTLSSMAICSFDWESSVEGCEFWVMVGFALERDEEERI